MDSSPEKSGEEKSDVFIVPSDDREYTFWRGWILRRRKAERRKATCSSSQATTASTPSGADGFFAGEKRRGEKRRVHRPKRRPRVHLLARPDPPERQGDPQPRLQPDPGEHGGAEVRRPCVGARERSSRLPRSARRSTLALHRGEPQAIAKRSDSPPPIARLRDSDKQGKRQHELIPERGLQPQAAGGRIGGSARQVWRSHPQARRDARASGRARDLLPLRHERLARG